MPKPYADKYSVVQEYHMELQSHLFKLAESLTDKVSQYRTYQATLCVQKANSVLNGLPFDGDALMEHFEELCVAHD